VARVGEEEEEAAALEKKARVSTGGRLSGLKWGEGEGQGLLFARA
jgi:hypothetical protein